MNKLWSLYNKYKEIINYLIFGVLTTIVSLVSYYLLTINLLDVSKVLELQMANVLSWFISVLFAYITNRKFVFESNNSNLVKEISSFFGSRVVTLFFDMVIMFVGVTLLKGNDKFIKIISQVVVIISNYLLSKLFVFKKNKERV